MLPLDPFAFSGESQVSCTLLGGPIRDFNLIYAPQRYSARLQWLAGEQRFFSSAGTVLVFSVSDALEVKVGNSDAQLGRHDCLQLDGNAGLAGSLRQRPMLRDRTDCTLIQPLKERSLLAKILTTAASGYAYRSRPSRAARSQGASLPAMSFPLLRSVSHSAPTLLPNAPAWRKTTLK